MFTVYILACSDGTYHSGVTKNLDMRLRYHEQGNNPDAFTFNRRPTKSVFEKSFSDVQTAVAFEAELQTKSTSEIARVISGKLIIETITTTPSDVEEMRSKTKLILPVSYLGNLAYFSQLHQIDELILDVNERFQKQTYRNRATIYSANGLQNLIVPVIRPNGKDTRMSEVTISYVEGWVKNHIKAIESAYRRAPYFEYYATDLFAILEENHGRLVDLNKALTIYLLDCFGIHTTVRLSNSTEESSIPMKILMNPKSRKNHENTVYRQVLNTGVFEGNLSLIDLLFNAGKSGID